MNKFIKLSGALCLVFGLFRISSSKSRRRIRSSFVTDRQLFNRLMEQINVSKAARSKLNRVLCSIDFIPVNRQLNRFANQIKPRFDKIKSESLRLGKHTRS